MNNFVKVSVIMPSYNHASFIGEAIESVLAQGFKDYELLIADDCSTDNSCEVINKYKDKRIRNFYFKINIGAVNILNFLIAQATGEYIAILNSDDYWCLEKLNQQVTFLDSNPSYAACFTWAEFVDECGDNIIFGDEVYTNIFKQKNKSQGKWMEYFFYNGNCLCHPSVLIRKRIYKEIGLYNPSLRQLPDFEYWIRLINKYPIHIIEDILVKHRRLKEAGENTSVPSHDNFLRNKNELLYIYHKMFSEIEDEIFIDGFRNRFKNRCAQKKVELMCEKYFILLNGCCIGDLTKPIAIAHFMEICLYPNVKSCFEQKYNYRIQDFYDLTGKISIDIFDVSNKSFFTPSSCEIGNTRSNGDKMRAKNKKFQIFIKYKHMLTNSIPITLSKIKNIFGSLTK